MIVFQNELSRTRYLGDYALGNRPSRDVMSYACDQCICGEIFNCTVFTVNRYSSVNRYSRTITRRITRSSSFPVLVVSEKEAHWDSTKRFAGKPVPQVTGRDMTTVCEFVCILERVSFSSLQSVRSIRGVAATRVLCASASSSWHTPNHTLPLTCFHIFRMWYASRVMDITVAETDEW